MPVWLSKAPSFSCTFPENRNATSKILTTGPRGHQVTMVGTANGGAWAHVYFAGVTARVTSIAFARAPSAPKACGCAPTLHGFGEAFPPGRARLAERLPK